jgi:alkylhydroperoxidase family enzyme
MDANLSQIGHGRCLHVMTHYRGDDMTSQTRIPATEITGVYGALVRTFSKKMFGKVPESLGVPWHNPPVLKASMGFGQKLQKWDRCDESLKSFAHMAVASYIGCTWCLDFNYFMARNQGLDLDKAQQVPRWRESDVFTPLERDVLEYAEAMSATPVAVTDELAGRLLEQLGAAALVELTSVIGFANLTTRGNVAMGIESEGFAAACGLKPLAERPATADLSVASRA